MRYLCLLALAFSLATVAFGAPDLPHLLAYSLDDQTASFRLADGQIVLAEAGQVFREEDRLTLERVLVDRLVLSRVDPRAPGQLERIWIDYSRGIDAATVKVLASIPEKQPEMLHFEKPIVIPIEGSLVPPAAQKPPR